MRKTGRVHGAAASFFAVAKKKKKENALQKSRKGMIKVAPARFEPWSGEVRELSSTTRPKARSSRVVAHRAILCPIKCSNNNFQYRDLCRASRSQCQTLSSGHPQQSMNKDPAEAVDGLSSVLRWVSRCPAVGYVDLDFWHRSRQDPLLLFSRSPPPSRANRVCAACQDPAQQQEESRPVVQTTVVVWFYCSARPSAQDNNDGADLEAETIPRHFV